MKIVTIVEDNPITGVKYGLKEIPETPVTKMTYKRAQDKIRATRATVLRRENTKHK